MVEDPSHDSNEVSGLVTETLGHLTIDHMTYFTQWCLMLDLESQVDQSKRTVADIWCKSSSERYYSFYAHVSIGRKHIVFMPPASSNDAGGI